MKTVFEYVEEDAARICGVARDQFREARKAHLVKGKDWQLERGTILLSAAGLNKLLTVLEISVDVVKNAPERPQAEKPGHLPRAFENARQSAPRARAGHDSSAVVLYDGPNRGHRKLTFVRTWKNPRIIGCECDGRLVRVRVKNNRNFRKGMIVPVRPIGHDFYEITCRCPRRPGRW